MEIRCVKEPQIDTSIFCGPGSIDVLLKPQNESNKNHEWESD